MEGINWGAALDGREKKQSVNTEGTLKKRKLTAPSNGNSCRIGSNVQIKEPLLDDNTPYLAIPQSCRK
jgi:hypothetical protein